MHASSSGRRISIAIRSRAISGISISCRTWLSLRCAHTLARRARSSTITVEPDPKSRSRRCLVRVQGEAVGRVRYQLLEKMLQPCGPPPEKEDGGD